MDDLREKVIKGLFICSGDDPDCQNCPYYGEYGDGFGCETIMQRDALSLLKAQEPRVMTLEEIKDGEPYWLSTGKEFAVRPVICVCREDDARKPYITFKWQFGTFSWEAENYGKTWFCWTSRPTDEQQEGVKWE